MYTNEYRTVDEDLIHKAKKLWSIHRYNALSYIYVLYFNFYLPLLDIIPSAIKHSNIQLHLPQRELRLALFIFTIVTPHKLNPNVLLELYLSFSNRCPACTHTNKRRINSASRPLPQEAVTRRQGQIAISVYIYTVSHINYGNSHNLNQIIASLVCG